MRISIKLVIILFILCIFVSGCAKTGKPADTAPGQPREFDVVFITWNYEDALSVGYVHSINLVCNGLLSLDDPVRINMHWYTANSAQHTLEQLKTINTDSIDAVISLYLNYEICDLLKQKGIYYCSYTYFDEETDEYARKSEYYLGTVHEGRSEAAAVAIEKLILSGCREIVLLGLSSGLYNHDLFWPIWYEVLEDYPEVVVHEYRGTDFYSALNAFFELYPDIDGICTTCSSAGFDEQIVMSLDENELTGRVLCSTTEFTDKTADYLSRGAICLAAGGTQSTVGYMLILIVNRLMGTPLFDGPVTVDWSNIFINSKQEYDQFYKYCYESDVFSFEEYLPYLKWLNPDASAEAFLELPRSITLETVIKRHE